MRTWKRWSLGVLLAVGMACAGGISDEALNEAPGFRVFLCQEDSDCEGGYLCKAGFCRPGCRKEGDCEGDYVCTDIGSDGLGFCQPRAVEVGCGADDNACGGGYVCKDGFCKPGCRGGGIQSCPEGYVCEGSPGSPPPPGELGLCRPGCLVGDSCGKGSGYVCVKANGSNAAATLGVCKAGCRIHTKDDVTIDDCSSGFFCLGDTNQKNDTGTCRPGCRIYATHGVTTDNCGSGFFCQGDTDQKNDTGTCRPGCRVGESTCPNGQVCVGYGGNIQKGAPGFCRVKCSVSTSNSQSTCGTNQHCIGIVEQKTDADGSCRNACAAAGIDTSCGEDEICEGTANKNNPLACRPGCRVGNASKGCLAGQTCNTDKRCQ